MHRGALALAAAILNACAGAPSPSPAAAEPALADPDAPIACKAPRPEVCTMIYAPVCATLEGDLAQSQYSSPCNACADDRVVAYREGTCE
ncbi:MAG: hypothetical protein RIC38_00295 [Chromatocurvus sp.]